MGHEFIKTYLSGEALYKSDTDLFEDGKERYILFQLLKYYDSVKEADYGVIMEVKNRIKDLEMKEKEIKVDIKEKNDLLKRLENSLI